ncbi:calcitonin receptor-like [Onthophagus taurus]|uniref:calcitonin receptor-like n=1 Tax=Onthophagus taurus TaxID=166361 RepID=UPI000C206566|nr:calcitonin receptor-like [Onthophagus taurus]
MENEVKMTNSESIYEQIKSICASLNRTNVNTTDQGYCPLKLDTMGFCWPPLEINGTIELPCHSKNTTQQTYALGICQSNGTWLFNRANCTDIDTLEFYNLINKLYVIGYSISLVSLIISLAIFLVFRLLIDRIENAHPIVEHKRSLRCTRIRLHIHLFISFVLNNVIWILWYTEVIWKADEGVTLINPIWCQLLFLAKTYTMLTNYTWMFCEALYLHLSLVVVFVRDEVAMRYFIAIGWGLPLIITTSYACVRIFVHENTEQCWMYYNNSWSEWILIVPVGLSLIASFIFLINVLKVILNVMHPRSSDPAMAGIKRAARAAIILVPLFGLHFLLIPFRPSTPPYVYIYEYISVLLIAPQGFCVCCLFCFANHDVHQAITSFIHRQLHSSRWSYYYYSGGADSAGVYVINNHTQSNNFALI